MLGSLIQSLNPLRRKESRSEPSPSTSGHLESVTEEAHTYNLLWPDFDTAQLDARDPYSLQDVLLSPTISPKLDFDIDANELGAVQLKHVRVFIAQDETNTQSRCILYDSNAPTAPVARVSPRRQPLPAGRGVPSAMQNRQAGRTQPALTQESANATLSAGNSPQHARTTPRGAHARALSAGSLSNASRSLDEAPAAFLNRFRMQNSAPIPEHGLPPVAQQQQQQQQQQQKSNDELRKACLECMFGNNGVKQPTTTKLHVIPNANPIKASEMPNWRIRRNSQFTTERAPLDSTQLDSAALKSSPELEEVSQSVLITRVFSLPVLGEAMRRDSESALSYMRDGTAEIGASLRSNKPPPSRAPNRQRRLPSYAVAFLITVPARSNTSLPNQAILPNQPASKNHSFSVTEDTPSLCSSLDSDLQKSWLTFGSLSRIDSMLSSSCVEEPDYNDLIARHWIAISRSLRALQMIAMDEIRDLVTGGEATALEIRRQIASTLTTRRRASVDPFYTKRPALTLADGLNDRAAIRLAVQQAKERLQRALTSRPVFLGSGRWTIWRDEAYWVRQWELQNKRDSFLAAYLTASLAVHQEWLTVLGSRWLRQHRARLPRAMCSDGICLPARTLVVSNDRMAARRLIFLLASFFPNGPSNRAVSSPRSKRGNAYTTINNDLLNSPISHLSNTETDPRSDASNLFAPMMLKKSTQHGRAARAVESDLSKALKLSATPELSAGTESHSAQDTSAGITTAPSTVASSLSTPVAHLSRCASVQESRRVSTSSLASARLKENLHHDSMVLASVGDEATGPAIKRAPFEKFWKGSSTHQAVDRTLDIQSSHNNLPGTSTNAKPPVRDGSQSEKGEVNKASVPVPIRNPKITGSNRQGSDHTGSVGLPFQLSVSASDGFIDINVPLPYIDSPLGSPRHFVMSPKSPMDAGELNSTSSTWPYAAGDSSFIEVAGYLESVSRDVHVQAVRPYSKLNTDVRNMMMEDGVATTSSSPTEATEGSQGLIEDGWQDICTTIIADTQSWTVKRLRMQRLIGRADIRGTTNIASQQPIPAKVRVSQAGQHEATASEASQVAADPGGAERFVEDVIATPDPVLASAIYSLLEGRTAKVQDKTRHNTEALSSIPKPSRQAAAVTDLGEAAPPRQHCRKTMLGALERIADAAIAEADKADRNGEGKGPQDDGAASPQRRQSVLEEQLARWLT